MNNYEESATEGVMPFFAAFLIICAVAYFGQDDAFLSYLGFKSPGLNRQRTLEVAEIMGWYEELESNLIILNFDDLAEHQFNRMLASKQPTKDSAMQILRDQYR